MIRIIHNLKIVIKSLLILLLLFGGACDNYKFMRKFEPLLDRDLAVDSQYRDFEGSLPNDKHWQQNMSTLKGMVDEKTDVLQKLKAITPTRQHRALYNTLVDDLNNSIAYLNSEINYFHKNAEYAVWLANSIYEGGGRTASLKNPDLLKAKEEVLRVQAQMTEQADPCNTAQARLAKLLAEKNLRRNYEPLRYAKYQKEHVGYKIKG